MWQNAFLDKWSTSWTDAISLMSIQLWFYTDSGEVNYTDFYNFVGMGKVKMGYYFSLITVEKLGDLTSLLKVLPKYYSVESSFTKQCSRSERNQGTVCFCA